MGLMDRFKAGGRRADAQRHWVPATLPPPPPPPPPVPTPVTAPVAASARIYPGNEGLEVVGESHYQSALWSLCGGTQGERVHHPIDAVLVPEPDNPYDPLAIAVQIEGLLIGYLARETAALYHPGVHRLMAETGCYVALTGVIVGGGYYNDGPGMLGVWLDHDPAHFGLGSARRSGPPGRPAAPAGAMRTGFQEAWLTDIEDDSYDLSWFDQLPDADRPAIAMLRDLLRHDPDPIDRHFQYAELETRLYRCRDLHDAALDEYDAVCARHDAEMDTICEAFRAKWGKVPLLETYRQMAIRQQKRKDWEACLRWVERGLALYGSSAAREDVVEDLLKRRNRALAKLEAAASGPEPGPHRTSFTTSIASRQEVHPPPGDIQGRIDVLTCTQCQGTFERLVVRGRKPLLCPACR